MAKPALRDSEREVTTKQTLGVVLRDILKLFHPIIPFVTEELWSELVGDGMIITASWPSPPPVEAGGDVETLKELVAAVRSFRGEHQLGATRMTVLLDDPDGVAEPWWTEQVDALGRADLVSGAPEDPSGHARLPAGRVTCFIPLEGLIDLEAERPRLAKAISEVEALLDRSNQKLGNPSFVERAPAEIVANERLKVEEFEHRLARLHEQVEQLG